MLNNTEWLLLFVFFYFIAGIGAFLMILSRMKAVGKEYPKKIYLLLDLIASLFLWLIMPIFYHIAKKKGRI